MSGALLSGIGAFGAVSGPLNTILFGGSGPVVLGGIVLQEQEVPASIKWGGKQKLNVHRMPGGARVIDAMGRDDAAITWSGRMFGEDDGDGRAWLFDQMRINGFPVALQWGSHLFSVVIDDFSATDAAFMVEYSISCTVLRDETAAPASLQPSLLAQIISDIGAAENLVSAVSAVVTDAAANLPDVGAQISALGAAVASVQGLAQSSGPVTAGSAAAASLASAAASAQSIATAAVYDGDAQIGYLAGQATASGSLLGSTSAPLASANLVTLASYSGVQAVASAARGMVARIADNLAAPSGATEAPAFFPTATPPAQAIGGAAGMTLQTAGGNLFAIAAQQLGDATQWYRIAQASGLSDPMLSGVVTLTIPPAIQAPSDGVPDLYGVTIL